MTFGPSLGHLATKPSLEIPASGFSIGCETLDRGMWDFDAGLPQIADLGAKWARVQTGWAKCETTRGCYDFAWLDHIVDALLAVGIQPWFNVGYGNRLYTPGAPHPTAVGWTPVHEPAARAGWSAFTTALARHYHGRVRWYEVWNEPDIRPFWTPHEPSPANYADLIALTATKVVGGAMAGALSEHGLQWVEGLFESGIGAHVDAFSYHLYVPTPEPVYEVWQPRLRALVERYRPGLPLWQGESGAPSKAVAGQALADCEFDEQRQAIWNTRRALLDLTHGTALSAFFHAADFQFYIIKDQIVPQPYYFGLLGGVKHRRKPAFLAAQTLCTLLAGQPRPQAAPVDGENTRAWWFATADYGRLLAYWRAQDVMRPAPPGTTRLPGGFRAPVLVDPLTQAVYALPEPAPLVDWPLLVAERQALPCLWEQ